VLLVDDSPFFRNLLTPLLSVAGYDVTAVETASEAMALCEAGEDFDVIVSDIEMPGMSGFEFAQAVRHGSRWQHVPLVELAADEAAVAAIEAELIALRAAVFAEVAPADLEAACRVLRAVMRPEREPQP